MKNLFLLILFIPGYVSSQNLILNPGIEDTIQCPPNIGYIEDAMHWSQPTWPDPDYYHSCSFYSPPGYLGYQLPHGGEAYIGGSLGSPTTNYREYMQVKLASPLIAGQCYQLSFYASAAHQNYSTDAIQAYFSDTTIYMQITNLLPFIPQVVNTPGNFIDTLNWTLIQGEFVANGGENFVIIGNFIDYTQCAWPVIGTGPNNTCYAYFDDFSLINVTCTSVEENKEINFSVYPNPFQNSIQFLSNNLKPNELIVYNNLMEIILTKSFSNSLILETEKWANGIYYYSFKGKNTFGKMIKN